MAFTDSKILINIYGSPTDEKEHTCRVCGNVEYTNSRTYGTGACPSEYFIREWDDSTTVVHVTKTDGGVEVIYQDGLTHVLPLHAFFELDPQPLRGRMKRNSIFGQEYLEWMRERDLRQELANNTLVF